MLKIIRLVGTTKTTIAAIRDRTHWNSTNLQPLDPVTLGISSQIDLDFEVAKAAKYLPKVEEGEVEDGLLPASETRSLTRQGRRRLQKTWMPTACSRTFGSLGGSDAEPASE